MNDRFDVPYPSFSGLPESYHIYEEYRTIHPDVLFHSFLRSLLVSIGNSAKSKRDSMGKRRAVRVGKKFF